jgi:hypothetical protein
VLPDPYRNALVVVSPDGCPSDPQLGDCVHNRGGVFQRDQSDTWNRVSGQTWDPTESTVNPPSTPSRQNKTRQRDPMAQLPVASNITTKFGVDRVTGMSNGKPWIVHEQGILSASTMYPFVGLLGLATNVNGIVKNPTSLFDNIRGLVNLKSVSWSYTAGRASDIPGSLILGGYDASRFNKSTTVLSLMHRKNRIFTTWLGDITVNDPAQAPQRFNQPRLIVDLDFSNPFLFMPMEVCEHFENSFGIKWNDDQRLYLIDEVKHDELVARNVSVTFTIHGDSGKQDFVIPYKSLVLNAAFPKVTQSVRYFALQRARAGFFSLGRAFLQETYITAVFDDAYGGYFNLSQAQYSPNASPQIVEIVPRTRDRSRIGAGAIVGLVFAFAILGTIAFLVWAKATKHVPFAKPKNRRSDNIELGSRRDLLENLGPRHHSAERNEHDDGASTEGSIYYEALSDIKNGEGSSAIQKHEESPTEPEKKENRL